MVLREHTCRARARQRDSLEPHREKVHDGKVAVRYEEVLYADEDWDFLAEEEGREDGLGSDEELKENESDEE